MRAIRPISSALLTLALILSMIPAAAPQEDEVVPIVMSVYRDGTVEFSSSFSTTEVELPPGVSSLRALLELSEAVTGSQVRLGADVTLEGDPLITVSTFVRRTSFGIVFYPDASYATFDFYLQLVEGAFPFTEEGNTFYPTIVTARGNSTELFVDVTATVEIVTVPPYTAQALNQDIDEVENDIEALVVATFAQMGYLTSSFTLSHTVLAATRSQVRVDLRLEGNITEIVGTTYGIEVEFNPILILGAFLASPDRPSRLTMNLSDTGLLDFKLTLNYSGSYDALINRNRSSYLDWVESIARQDMENGEPWLPLIGLLRDAELSSAAAGFDLDLDYSMGTFSWLARSPRMKVGRVSDSTVSLKAFLDALEALDPYIAEIGVENFAFAIRGVEDEVAYMEIVVPPGTPPPRSRNSSTGLWEGVYPDQLQDVSFNIVLKDTTPPTVTPGISPGATVSEKRPRLAATLSDNVAIDVGSVVVKVDGVDVTSAATVTSSSVSYTPASDLQDGQHTFYISVKDTAGNPKEVTISFTVSTGIPIAYLASGAVVVIVVLGAAVFLLMRRKPSAPEAVGPPPPPPPA